MVNKTLTKIFFVAGLAALAVVGFVIRSQDTMETKTIRVKDVALVVEVAQSRVHKQQGLSNRESLAQDRGMLFVYSEKKMRSFWMKDMRFPLDVLWIADGVVVGLQENIPFQSDDGEVVRFKSNEPANMALEVNSGWIEKHGVSIGDQIVF